MTLVGIVMILLSAHSIMAQKQISDGKKKSKKKEIGNDTLYVEAGKLVIFSDTLLIPLRDTTFILPANAKVRVRENPYAQSDNFYDSLASRSNRNLVTRKLHQWLFRTSATELSDSINMLRSEAPFEPYEGYRIGDIRISSAEFLTGNVIDTVEVVKSSAAKVIDALHANTKKNVIRNNLLFKRGDMVSPYILADNERIIRELPFIRDSRILLLPRLDDELIVDVYVVTQERLSLFIDGDFGGFDDFTVEVGSRSFFGSGNKFSVAYQYFEEENTSSGYELNFKDFNLRGTFISSEITYSDLWDKKGYEVIFRRDFLTPETKWAGGLEFGDLEQIRFEDDELESLPNEDDSLRIPYERNFQDVWLGRAFLLKGSDSRVNLSIATRVFREEFTLRPFVDADSNHFFHDAVLWLNELVLTKRKFLKSTMIQAYGVTEDIPIGYRFQLIGGYEFGEFGDRPYWGLGAAVGDFWDGVGYFTTNIEIGGFVENRKFQEGVVAVDGLYFSPLLRFHRNQFRQFVTLNYSTAIKPLIEDQFGFREGIRGISREVQGDRKFSVNIESVLFHPLKLYGFRMATYAFYDFGWISFGGPLMKSVNFQSAIGIGFRLRNESLLFRTIQLRFGYLIQPAKFDVNFSFSDPSIFDNFRTNKPEIVKF